MAKKKKQVEIPEINYITSRDIINSLDCLHREKSGEVRSMYIKYHGFKCECGEIVAPDFYELHFNMREGEILENGSGELICEKCGAIYELEDMEFTPIFNRKDKRDKYGCWVRVCPTEDGEYVELGRDSNTKALNC